MTDAVVQSGTGDLIVVRPLVRSLAGGIMGGAAFASLLRRAMREAHLAVIERDRPALTVRVADVGTLVAGVLERFAPESARIIGAERAATLLTLRPGEGLLGVVRVARRVYSLAWLVVLLAVAAALGAVWISPRRRRTVRQLAIGMALGAMAVVALLTVGRAVAEQAASAGRGVVVGALWNSFLNGLRVQALLLAAAAAICSAAAGNVRLTAAGGQEAAARTRLAWSVALVMAGVAILLEPLAVLTVAAWTFGLYALDRGVAGLLEVMASDPAAVTSVVRPRLGGARRLAGPVAAFAAVAGVLACSPRGPATRRRPKHRRVAMGSRPCAIAGSTRWPSRPPTTRWAR